jgi:UDP-3-O-[3-hydroxymyristoyl] glucosamine N-acyltransferase
MSKNYTTQAIAEALEANLIGRGDMVISRIAHPADVHEVHDLAIAFDPSLLPLLSNSCARAAVIGKNTQPPENMESCIVVDRPRYAMAKLTNLFAEPVEVATGIHPSTVIEPGVKIGKNVSIGAFSYIGSGVTIGDNTVIHPQVYVGANTTIGNDSLLFSGVRIGVNIIIGERFMVHFNTTIGADGFSFVTPQSGSVEAAKAEGGSVVSGTNIELVRIASLGTVIIGDDVEIGANTSIDRGTIAATKIGNGTKIDNQVQIGHNVVIGENCLICGRVGIAGSAIIGNRVVLGGATGVADHVRIGDDAIAMGMSGVAGNVQPKTIVGGWPAMPRDRVMENMFNVGRIRQLMKKINSLEEKFNHSIKS